MDTNFFTNFYNCLLNDNFYKIENTNFKNDIYFKNIGSNGYIIAPLLKIDENYKQYFDFLEENCKILLEKYNMTKIFIVKILVSENFSNEDINFLDCELNLDKKIVNILWGVNLSNNKIIIKANQPTKFLDIEKHINVSIKNDIIKPKNTINRNNYIISKNTYLTYSIICILVFIHILIASSSYIQKDFIIYNYGISPNLIKDNEYYRLITFLFIHSGLTHLLSNILSLYIFGTRIERYLGKIAFLLIFLIGGIFSGIFSIIFTKNYSIGASGAIFALESATLYFSIKEKIKLDGLDYYIIAMFSITGILASFSDKKVDNAGHIGGFIMGFIICYIYYNVWYKKYKNNL